ncbi:unnamed protein product [Arctogadus glacialis]
MAASPRSMLTAVQQTKDQGEVSSLPAPVEYNVTLFFQPQLLRVSGLVGHLPWISRSSRGSRRSIRSRRDGIAVSVAIG